MRTKEEIEEFIKNSQENEKTARHPFGKRFYYSLRRTIRDWSEKPETEIKEKIRKLNSKLVGEEDDRYRQMLLGSRSALMWLIDYKYNLVPDINFFRRIKGFKNG